MTDGTVDIARRTASVLSSQGRFAEQGETDVSQNVALC